jgi:hypothetical protein
MFTRDFQIILLLPFTPRISWLFITVAIARRLSIVLLVVKAFFEVNDFLQQRSSETPQSQDEIIGSINGVPMAIKELTETLIKISIEENARLAAEPPKKKISFEEFMEVAKYQGDAAAYALLR